MRIYFTEAHAIYVTKIETTITFSVNYRERVSGMPGMFHHAVGTIFPVHRYADGSYSQKRQGWEIDADEERSVYPTIEAAAVAIAERHAAKLAADAAPKEGDRVVVTGHDGYYAKDYNGKIGIIEAIAQKGGRPLYYVSVPYVAGAAGLRAEQFALASADESDPEELAEDFKRSGVTPYDNLARQDNQRWLEDCIREDFDRGPGARLEDSPADPKTIRVPREFPAMGDEDWADEGSREYSYGYDLAGDGGPY